MASETPLGRKTDYPDRYSPELLHAIPRADSRAALGIDAALPFSGVDIWNAWELTWLGPDGRPRVATAEVRVPADSDNIVESKSLKLYLNSFAMSRYDDAAAVADTIGRDLGRAVGAKVGLRLDEGDPRQAFDIGRAAGACIDGLDVACDRYEVDATLLTANPDEVVEEQLHSHLLRSLCPVTAQPDHGSVLLDYAGPRIDAAGLLRYIVSFRDHADFHEACVERMFVDIHERCAPRRLSVYARYQRRGGIDINPFRSSEETEPANLRLWRQ